MNRDTMNTQEEQIVRSEGAQLCLHCGLCCKGYFHSQAIINNEEDLNLAKNMGASIVEYTDNKQYFQLPCPKFNEKCSIYPYRPSVCENHQCDLLKRVLEGEIGLEKAINISSEMKKLCTTLDQVLDTLSVGTLRKRFSTLFTSKDATMREKKYADLMLTYAAYQLLKNKYFYQEQNFYDKNSSDPS